MRPDLDEFEELNEADAPRSRAMSWLVLVVAVGGFAALAYYAYHSGSASMKDGQVLVVEADSTPIKEIPADREGEEFPNKDKTIYDAISPDANADMTEKLLPEPEKPVIPEPAKAEAAPAKAEATTTFVNKSLTKEEAVDPVDTQSMKQGGPEATPAPTAEPKVVTVSEAPVVTKATPVPEKPTQKAPEGAPKFENVKPAQPAPTKSVAATGGNYKIQLGAFKSENEALTQWKKIAAKHGLKGSPIVTTTQNDKGTFYRLRTSGYASAAAAKSACASLSAKGQACMSVGQ